MLLAHSTTVEVHVLLNVICMLCLEAILQLREPVFEQNR